MLGAGQRSPRLLAMAALHLAPLFLACPPLALSYQHYIKQLLLCDVDHTSSQVCHHPCSSSCHAYMSTAAMRSLGECKPAYLAMLKVLVLVSSLACTVGAWHHTSCLPCWLGLPACSPAVPTVLVSAQNQAKLAMNIWTFKQ